MESDHSKVAENAISTFSNCYYNRITSMLGPAIKNIPLLGLSHSLGGKLTAIIGSTLKFRKTSPKRVGNVYLAFNNFGIRDSIGLSMSQASKSSPELKSLIDLLDSPSIKSAIEGISSSSIISSVTDTVRSRVKNSSSFLGDLINGNFDSSAPFDKLEFNPSPEETWALILQGYNVKNNVLVKFSDDEIDQSDVAAKW